MLLESPALVIDRASSIPESPRNPMFIFALYCSQVMLYKEKPKYTPKQPGLHTVGCDSGYPACGRVLLGAKTRTRNPTLVRGFVRNLGYLQCHWPIIQIPYYL